MAFDYEGEALEMTWDEEALADRRLGGWLRRVLAEGYEVTGDPQHRGQVYLATARQVPLAR